MAHTKIKAAVDPKTTSLDPILKAHNYATLAQLQILLPKVSPSVIVGRMKSLGLHISTVPGKRH